MASSKAHIASTKAIRRRQAKHDAIASPRIRELRIQGFGWKRIAAILTEEGVPTSRAAATGRRLGDGLGALAPLDRWVGRQSRHTNLRQGSA